MHILISKFIRAVMWVISHIVRPECVPTNQWKYYDVEGNYVIAYVRKPIKPFKLYTFAKRKGRKNLYVIMFVVKSVNYGSGKAVKMLPIRETKCKN